MEVVTLGHDFYRNGSRDPGSRLPSHFKPPKTLVLFAFLPIASRSPRSAIRPPSTAASLPPFLRRPRPLAVHCQVRPPPSSRSVLITRPCLHRPRGVLPLSPRRPRLPSGGLPSCAAPPPASLPLHRPYFLLPSHPSSPPASLSLTAA
ncbi:hypothetical protein Scep_030378 [Stephania cephalantha]|uniref:Uncharacterized protein n=1 Tax=Stephania cephalantha TaxID=152367 RepID=A0AAP0HGF6_9MAGN